MRSIGRLFAAVGITLMSLAVVNPANVSPVHASSNITVIHSDPVGLTKPIRDLKNINQCCASETIDGTQPEVGGPTPVKNRPVPAVKGGRQIDTTVQRTVRHATSIVASGPVVGVSFDAMNEVQSGCNCLPPDTNTDVSNHYIVETVNSAFAVYAKDGSTLLAPHTINTLFSGYGGQCEARNDGDPIVLYDSAADRWLISEFTAAAPYHECIAISKTGDPTGAYYLYGFQLSTTLFADYPHFGVWPNAYYMTTNEFDTSLPPASQYQGSQAWAFDRSAMLTGAPATLVTPGPNGLNSNPMLPADMDGTPPPAGQDEFVLEYPLTNAGDMNLYTFHADFATPANTTFAVKSVVAGAPFNQDCTTSGRSCIPQPSTTVKLDAISDRFMYRLAYRRIVSGANTVKEALLTNYTIDPATPPTTDQAAPRWLEIDNPSTIAAAGTTTQLQDYVPTADNRWMGSVDMDRMQNILLGYSVASATVFPSIRVAGQQAGDPVNTLRPEVSILAGTGSQSGNAAFTRWGDYSSMKVDPSDGCTFWYSQEYNNSFNALWSTRIASIRFPNCDNTAASLVTSAGTPSSAGSVDPVTVTAKDAQDYIATPYTGTVTLSSSDPLAKVIDPVTGNPVALNTPHTFNVNDAGSHTFGVVFGTQGNQTVTATDGTFTSNTAPVLVTAPVASFSVSAPGAVGLGFQFNFNVSALDAGNSLLTTYTGTLHFTSTDPNAILPSDYTFTGADGGTHTFSAEMLTAGPQTITVTDTGSNVNGTSNVIQVSLINTFVNGTNGHDSNSCTTAAAPCKTITGALPKTSATGTVTIAPGTYNENVVLNNDVTLNGNASTVTSPTPINLSGPAPVFPSSTDTIIDGTGLPTGPLVIVAPNVTATIDGLTIQNGNGGTGVDGGGVQNQGASLTLIKDTIRNNTVNGGSASTQGLGAGVFNNTNSVLNVLRSTINGNSATGAGQSFGGGLYSFGPMTVVNSTITGNSSAGASGAVRDRDGLHIFINDTIDKNSTASGGQMARSGADSQPVRVQNTIITDPTAGTNCTGTFTSLGNNVVGTDCTTFTGTGDQKVASANLGPLTDNGGPTQTQAPSTSAPVSPAIGNGNLAACTAAPVSGLDQRGFTRPSSGNCTVGSFESPAPTVSRVARFTAARHGSVVTFRWHLAVTEGVLGFNLTRGSTVLNTHLIAVHASPSYSFRTHLSGAKSGVKLTVLLKDGGLQAVALSR